MNELMEDIRKINEMARELKMKRNPDYDFEEYLMQRFFEDGGQHKDDFFDWLDGIPVENLIEWSGEFAEQCVRRAKA